MKKEELEKMMGCKIEEVFKSTWNIKLAYKFLNEMRKGYVGKTNDKEVNDLFVKLRDEAGNVITRCRHPQVTMFYEVVMQKHTLKWYNSMHNCNLSDAELQTSLSDILQELVK